MEKQQAFNPYLPSYEYIPDGEPYVFGDRLYLFGSHDAFNADGFCVNDYVCYSAPLDDLGNWKCEGVIYRKTQDPLNKKGKQVMNAPDVCKGADGRYYLYYQLHLEKITSVAVSEKPEGPYEFYGHVHHKNSKGYGNRRGETYNFDPSVFMDDDGRIYMYTGFSPADQRFMRLMKLRGSKCIGGTVVELEKDMITIKENEAQTIPGELYAQGTEFEGHGFFEASSIRKINGVYYLVYSSSLSHELCYATAKSPMGPFSYGGTLVSIGDIGLNGITEKNARNFTGNTHGGMVKIHGQWYIFYHRQTNRQKCARQGCAEKIYINTDGAIKQVEITSCGLNEGPLKGIGYYEARIACNLWGNKGTYAYVKTRHEKNEYPYFTQTGGDRENNPNQYIANMKDGAVAGFKYFDFSTNSPATITVYGKAAGEGKLLIYTEKNPFESGEEKNLVAELMLKATVDETQYEGNFQKPNGVSALYFEYKGTGHFDFKGFEIM